jgi:hypothetical protein
VRFSTDGLGATPTVHRSGYSAATGSCIGYPTAEEINALEEKLRQSIQTSPLGAIRAKMCDPSRAQLREDRKSLQKRVEESSGQNLGSQNPGR